MNIAIISIFPEMVSNALSYGVTSRGIERNIVNITYFNPRDYTLNNYQRVDDRPYGGGPGMVMMYQPLQKSILAAKKALGDKAKVVYLSPQGDTFEQKTAEKLTKEKNLILLCGRYEGIDERLIDEFVDIEISVGDYVLSGGEIPAMVVIDAITRLMPGVLNDSRSAEQDSFSNGLLDCQHYTRPSVLENGVKVPSVLLSGDHSKIEEWRYSQQLQRTNKRRKDMIKCLCLSDKENKIITEVNSDVNDKECTQGENNEE